MSTGHEGICHTTRYPKVFNAWGTLRWFDLSRGYGFITPDDGGEDILLHVQALRVAGHLFAPNGSRIHCEVLRRPKGLQAFRVLSIDVAKAVDPSQFDRRTYNDVKPESGWELAQVKWYNRERGFGFVNIVEYEGPDVFVHAVTLRRYGFVSLDAGETVEVRWGRGSHGFTVAEIRIAASSRGGRQ